MEHDKRKKFTIAAVKALGLEHFRSHGAVFLEEECMIFIVIA